MALKGAANRIIQGVSVITVVFLLIYLGWWCLKPSRFPITAVKFVGERHYLSTQQLQEAVQSHLKEGFIRLKVLVLQQQLLSLPWVKKISIRRVWPDQLVIHFEEHQAGALWADGIISTEGELFYPDFIPHLTLPLLHGPTGKHHLVWDEFLRMQKILIPLNVTITHVGLAARGAWHLRLSNGITVILGTHDMLARLARFVKAYKDLQNRQGELAYVDLRYTSGMAVGLKT